MRILVFALAITGVFAIPVSASLSRDAFAQQQKRAKTQTPTRPISSPVDSRIFQPSSHYMRERHSPTDGGNGG